MRKKTAYVCLLTAVVASAATVAPAAEMWCDFLMKLAGISVGAGLLFGVRTTQIIRDKDDWSWFEPVVIVGTFFFAALASLLWFAGSRGGYEAARLTLPAVATAASCLGIWFTACPLYVAAPAEKKRVGTTLVTYQRVLIEPAVVQNAFPVQDAIAQG